MVVCSHYNQYGVQLRLVGLRRQKKVDHGRSQLLNTDRVTLAQLLRMRL